MERETAVHLGSVKDQSKIGIFGKYNSTSIIVGSNPRCKKKVKIRADFAEACVEFLTNIGVVSYGTVCYSKLRKEQTMQYLGGFPRVCGTGGSGRKIYE